MAEAAAGGSATPRVKICGLTRPADARAAAAAGADLLGVVISPGFPRSVEPARAAGLRVDGVPLVGVVVDLPLDRLVPAARNADVAGLQLHGDEGPGLVEALRAEGPWFLWKSVRPRTEEELRDALDRWAGVVDGLHVEGWHPGRGGGVGAAFPWTIAEAVREEVPAGLAFVVAGGLVPDNVAGAVARLRPDVVDVSSGVEVRPGLKDPGKVAAFVRNARASAGSTP